MAQRVQAVPNPRYQTSPLETTGATIVSTRRVLVPPVVQAVFKGQRDYTGSSTSYIQFQIADNESFLDLKCLVLQVDLTVFGPNAADNSSVTSANVRTGGRDIDLAFDQSVSALINQLTIGSPQGLKFEEIMNYNMWANIVAVQTETQLHKQADLLKQTEFSKDLGQDYGLQHFTDQQWRVPCRIKCGERNRLYIRLDFSDFFQNMDLFPLFLLRNGLQITIYLESANKVFYAPHGSHRARDMVIQSNVASWTPSYLIGVGAYYYDTATSTATARSVPTQATTTAVYFTPNYPLSSSYTGTVTLVPTFNTLWLPPTTANSICQALTAGFTAYRGYLIPISMYEMNQIVWSGFIRVDKTYNSSIAHSSGYQQTPDFGAPFLVDPAAAPDQWLAPSADGNYTAQWTFTRNAPLTTEAALAALEATAYTTVPQLDVDQTPHAAYNTITGTLATAAALRNATAGSNISAAQTELLWIGVGFPMFSFNDQQWIPYVNFPQTPTTAEIASANNTIYYRGGRCVIHLGDAVPIIFNSAEAGAVATAGGVITVTASDAGFQVASPSQNGAASMLSMWNLASAARQIHYQIENPQLLLDLVKPGAQEFMQWQQAFSSPSGIPVKFKKPIYRKLNFQSQSSGLLQVQLPINVRSLTGVVFVLMDPALNTEPNDLLNCLALANLSTFQNRRLTEWNIQVGGQQYPAYPLQIRPDGTGLPYCDIHILENEKFFSVAGSASFNCNVTRPSIKKTRNMIAGGWLGSSNPIVGSQLGINQRCTYTDSSSTIYCMNLAKDWVRPFTTGIDSSQAGSIALNLYFKDPSGVSNVSSAFGGTTSSSNNATGARSFDIHMFALCDAVATLQETANLVRY